jgi:hypothetical protein
MYMQDDPKFQILMCKIDDLLFQEHVPIIQFQIRCQTILYSFSTLYVWFWQFYFEFEADILVAVLGTTNRQFSFND